MLALQQLDSILHVAPCLLSSLKDLVETRTAGGFSGSVRPRTSCWVWVRVSGGLRWVWVGFGVSVKEKPAAAI